MMLVFAFCLLPVVLACGSVAFRVPFTKLVSTLPGFLLTLLIPFNVAKGQRLHLDPTITVFRRKHL